MSSSTSLTQTRGNLPSTQASRINVVAAVTFLTPLLLGGLATWLTLNPAGAIVGLLLGLLLAQAPKIARQWERAVVLRLGRYVGLRGPGLFWIIPLLIRFRLVVPASIPTLRLETLTSHGPVNVDPYFFWMVTIGKAAWNAGLAAGPLLRRLDARHHRTHIVADLLRVANESKKISAMIDERSIVGCTCNQLSRA